MTISRQTLQGCRWLSTTLFVCSLLAVDRPQQATVQMQPGIILNAPSIKRTAVEAAAEAGDRQTLRAILRNGSLADQSAAFDALQSIDPQMTAEAIVADYRDRKLGTRLQSLQILDQSSAVDTQTVTGVLREALRDEDSLVRDYALLALARRTQPGAQTLSTSDLSGVDTQVQQMVQVRLADVDLDHSRLVDLMKKGDGVVQAAAFEALAAINPIAAFAELASELDDKASLNHLQTLELLLRTPDTDRQFLGRLLQKASESQDPMVKALASRALAQKNREDAEPQTTQTQLQ